ncbi:MAG: UDP-N-acetylmuramate--L-alanine ligase [Chlamydiia bacterium]|nr:UDP-N-acetylmuramate--L-alanine ligase [Chlamydiia bacterium]
MSQLYHFIGIGGIGMSGLARILLQKGEQVSGSDRVRSLITQELELAGAQIFSSHASSHVSALSKVVYSTDIKPENLELLEAKRLGLPLMHRSELLAYLMDDNEPLLVTGTHGKTTTSSLLSYVLEYLGWDPTFAVGGVLKNFGVNSKSGKGAFFVAEADESDGTFLAYPRAKGAIITNIGLDHLNYWQTEQALVDGFCHFSEKVTDKRHFFWCKDDDRLAKLDLKGLSYGFDPLADVCVSDFIQQGFICSFSVTIKDVIYKDIQVPLIGRHNALNAAAVFALVVSLGASELSLRKAFMSFQGVCRRADCIGNEGGVSIYDDYGHHPTEVAATLKAFRLAFTHSRLVVVFQPHRYSRTRDCIDGFAEAFSDADVVILTDLYGAGEVPIPGINTETLYQKILPAKHREIYHLRKDVLVEFLAGFVREGDVVITMGAGDITKDGPILLQRLQQSDSSYAQEG